MVAFPGCREWQRWEQSGTRMELDLFNCTFLCFHTISDRWQKCLDKLALPNIRKAVSMELIMISEFMHHYYKLMICWCWSFLECKHTHCSPKNWNWQSALKQWFFFHLIYLNLFKLFTFWNAFHCGEMAYFQNTRLAIDFCCSEVVLFTSPFCN